MVPDNYLTCGALLGCDILGQAPLLWNGEKRTMMWGDTQHTVNHIPRRKNKVTRVQTSPVEMQEATKNYQQINLTTPVRLDHYHTQFLCIPTIEPPQTTLLIHPQPRFSHNSHPLLLMSPLRTPYTFL